MKAMAEAGSVGVILPTTAYILRLKHPPVRAMLDHGMIVALGSDFNPNAHCVSMPTSGSASTRPWRPPPSTRPTAWAGLGHTAALR